MAQGEVVLNVDYNVTKAEAKQEKLTAQWEKQKIKVDEQKAKVEQLRQKLSELTSEYERQTTTISGKEDVTVKEAETYERLAADVQKTNSEYVKTNAELGVQNARLNEIGTSIKENSNKQKAFGDAIKKTNNPLETFGKRISGLVKRVFIFSIITKALRAMRKALAEYISKDSELGKSLGQLKGNLQVLGTTLLESMRPAIQWVLNALVYLTNIIANVFANALGKDINQMKKFTKATKDNTKAAKGSLAAFDEINTLTKESTENQEGSTATPTFDGLNTNMSVDTLTKIGTVSGLAMMGLGLILALTGANIPLGLFLIVTGGLTAYGTIKENWGKINQETKSQITDIMTIASISMLALGTILLLSGANIPLGIGMIVVGVASMVTAATLNWGRIQELMRGTLGEILAIIGGFSLVLGVLLVLTGVGIPLGIGLILAGAASLGTVVAFNWNTIVSKVKDIGAKIKTVFLAVWDEIKLGFKSMVNGIISFANLWIDGLNKLLSPLRLIIYGIAKAFGSKISFDNVAIPHIPKLATGGIVPRSTIAQIGEKGKEAVLPLENNTGWMYTLADIINNGRTVDNRPIILKIGEREIARATRSGETALGKQTVFGGFANAY